MELSSRSIPNIGSAWIFCATMCHPPQPSHTHTQTQLPFGRHSHKEVGKIAGQEERTWEEASADPINKLRANRAGKSRVLIFARGIEGIRAHPFSFSPRGGAYSGETRG